MFDLYLLTLNIAGGREKGDLPGLLAATAPRRCDRSRAGDLLLAQFTLAEGAPLADEQVEKLLQNTAGAYFSARGSATAGLRAAIEDLNNLLLTNNLQKARQGGPRTGSLNLVVIRRDSLYLAQAGQTQALLLSGDEVQIFGDASFNSRKLGISRNVSIQFYQATLREKDLLLLSPNPPKNWNETTLAGSPMLTFEQLRRRLLSQSGEELQAVIVQFQAGKGIVHRLRPRLQVATPQEPQESKLPAENPQPTPVETSLPTAQPTATKIETSPREERKVEAQTAAPETTGSVSFVSPRPPVVEEAINLNSYQIPSQSPTPAEGIYIGSDQPAVPRSPASEAENRSVRTAGMQGNRRRTVLPGSSPQTPASARPGAPRAASQPGAAFLLRKKLAVWWFRGKTVGEQVQMRAKTFTGRLVPASASQPANLPVSTLLFIAIAVPLIVAAIATTIYSRSGWREQHYLYLQEAQKFANQAMAQTDPTLQENLWNQSQEWLEKAEGYGKTDESRTLRVQVQQAIDRLEGVLRMTLSPALSTPFPANVNITDIAVADNGDIYLLNQSEGRILRMFPTAQGYNVDDAFKCGPGMVGALQVGPLVDQTALEFTNKFGASILAIDAQGNLLYCIPGEEPISKALPETGGAGWSNITAIARDIQLDTLYVADAGRKMIVYFDGQQSVFDQEAHNAFDNYIPTALDLTIDVAFNEDLFILYSNGRVAWCTQRNYTFSAAECEDPAAFGDTRPNRTSDVAIFPNAKFTKLLASQPPDPALYIVEAGESSIYLFSLKLNLQYLLRPQFDEEYIKPQRPISAFAVAPGRVGILAFGNEIYTATLP
ncbi:MAG: hypothetical protein HPY59_08530 [Anaerolineae bacterium]|nr:hypothetical protein [Anaerolineae bacterium]